MTSAEEAKARSLQRFARLRMIVPEAVGERLTGSF
jgi:hypothetical protein